MTMISVGAKCDARMDMILAAVALSEMTGKIYVTRACNEGRFLSLRGSAAPKTMVVLCDGTVIVTPISVATIRNRIHAALPI